MRKLILMLLVISFLPLVTAGDVRYVGEKDANFDIREPCFNNGTYCGATATCNITVWIPRGGTPLASNVPMDRNPTYYNYTLNTTQTAESGEYQASISCCDGVLCDSDTFFFRITPSGHLYQQSESMVYGIILFVLLLISAFFLYIMKQTESDGVKLFFGMTGFVIIVATMGAARIFLDYTSLSGGIVNIISGLMFIITMVFVVTMYYVFVNQTRQAIQLMKAKKGFGDIESPKNF